MRKLLIIKAGNKLASLNSVPGDFEDWILAGMRRSTETVVVVPAHTGGSLPPVESVQGVVVTGSSAMVTDRLPWMLATEAWLREAVAQGVPVLGLCFGHQMLAQALGGRVDYNPGGVEVGTVQTRITSGLGFDPLFYGLEGEVPVQASHRQTVLELPAGAVRLASSALDDNHAFRVGRNIWGLQFHPEFSRDVTAGYVQNYAEHLSSQGQDAAAVAAGCVDTPVGSLLLSRFAALIDARL